jgi:hypothetical protein
VTVEQSRTKSHADVRASLARVGTSSKRIDEILADYPDPIDLTAAEPSLMSKFGISLGHMEEQMGGSP